MDFRGTAQLTFGFGGFLGQDVAFERLTALDGPTRTYAKALFGAAFRLHFRHSTFCPLDSSIFGMIAGGNISLRLDACFHLLCGGIKSAAIVQSVQKTSSTPCKIRYYFFFFGANTMIIWRPSIFGHCST